MAYKCVRLNDTTGAFSWEDYPTGGGEAWPVGSVFTSVVSTNPNTLLGYGTWAAFGAGRVLVGFDTNQTEFDTAEETGGAKSATLTTTELPAHTHVQDAHTHTQNSHNHTQDPHTHTLTGGATDDTSAPFPGPDAANSATVFASTAIQAATATNQAATATNQNATAVNQSTGSGAAFSLLNPYIVVYFFKRTA